VLVIDDEPAVRDPMQRFLSKEGFRCLSDKVWVTTAKKT
jgi:DNA-binding response OmpR family regulator